MKYTNVIKRFSVVAALIFTLLFISCYTPNPLYGTWTDNEGNKIQFIDDGTFFASIRTSETDIAIYEGDWSCVDNVLVFHIKADTAYTRNTEWDIRGAMLYLTWTANGSTKMLTLYHTAR